MELLRSFRRNLTIAAGRNRVNGRAVPRLALEKKDPKRKLERRRKREARKKNSCPGEPRGKTDERKYVEQQEKRVPSRYIPSEVRERVLERA